ncbi:hypothetical protein HNV10_11285 [Winogradskyella litoriviva]|uniref:Uncharacterized protein n=1 Tax=Winogradskyella litoriviva TaxID=1220182 RepID=A0ABX2E673_9FLAO|nr:hypothetical protein [Winogradskyella litoriviva]NRD23829.1 hypothetical protein [Winogradskyella litoriviva]
MIALFPYENLSIVTFTDINENLVVFNDIRYEREIYEESSPSAFFYSGPDCDDSYEKITVSMKSGSEYELYVSTGPGFKAAVVDDALGYFDLEENEYINYSFNDVSYDDALRIYSNYNDSEIILIPDIGVVSIQYGYQDYMPELWQSLILDN